jgi:COP9 signalosome complex subunit 1
LLRLHHLAQLILSSPSTSTIPLARDALKRLIPLIKETWDVNMYVSVSNTLADPPIAKRATGDVDMDDTAKTSEGQGRVDIDWIDSVRESERKEMGKLDTELKGYSSNLIKESMRVCL